MTRVNCRPRAGPGGVAAVSHAPLPCRPACLHGGAPNAGETKAGGRDSCHTDGCPDPRGARGGVSQAARGWRRKPPQNCAPASPKGHELWWLLGLSLSRPLQPEGADPTTSRVDTVPGEHLPAGSQARHREPRVGRAEPVCRPRRPARTPGWDAPRGKRDGSGGGRLKGCVKISTTNKKGGASAPDAR